MALEQEISLGQLHQGQQPLHTACTTNGATQYSKSCFWGITETRCRRSMHSLKHLYDGVVFIVLWDISYENPPLICTLWYGPGWNETFLSECRPWSILTSAFWRLPNPYTHTLPSCYWERGREDPEQLTLHQISMKFTVTCESRSTNSNPGLGFEPRTFLLKGSRTLSCFGLKGWMSH